MIVLDLGNNGNVGLISRIRLEGHQERSGQLLRPATLTRSSSGVLKRHEGNKNRTPKPRPKVFALESTCVLILSAFIRKTQRLMRTPKLVLTLALSFPYVVRVLSYFEVQE